MPRALLMAAGALCVALAPSLPVTAQSLAYGITGDVEISTDALVKRRLRQIDNLEKDLRRDRDSLAPCAAVTCMTPSEAAAAAFAAGPERKVAGRFILDVRAGSGPHDPNQLHTEDLFYLSSERGFNDFGTLVLAIEPAALAGLIRASGEAGAARPSMSRMMKRFAGQRLIVDGEVGLQWVEHRYWQTGLRTGRVLNQVWVRVTSPDQIRVVGPA
ncbi:MAG: hypothetical protein ACKO01_12270 [Erythrobacter sp.]